jgi:hypothetical protein
MPGPKPEIQIILSIGQRQRLEKIVSGAKSHQRDVLRARIVLLASYGRNNSEIATELSCTKETALEGFEGPQR